MDPENQNKSKYLLKLLEEGDAMVCLDARHPDVDVPASHKTNPMLNLVFNLSFRRPFDVREDGIYATLAFDRRPHSCVIPFEAVWAIYVPGTQAGEVWESSIPEDIQLEGRLLDAEFPRPRAVPTGEGPPPAEAAPSGETPAPAEKPATRGKGKSGRDRSHLRVIK